MNKELLYQNKRIFYRITGTGKPVVLIHGFGEDGNIWNNQAEYLKNKFQLIIPDLPGSGQSEMIDDMSMEGLADVIKEIIEIEVSKVPPSGGFRGASVIGHSMGGYITLALVEKYWNYVSAFGLFHSTAYADSEEKKTIRRKGIEFINQHGAFEFLKTTTPNLFSPNSILRQAQNQIPNSIQKLINEGNNFSPAALVSYYQAMMQRPDRTEILQKATVPVLFIMGKYDNAVPLKDGLQQCHLPEKSYIYVLRNSAHMGMLEEKDLSNEILEKFLLEL
jgi:pimeloyl-ACP methyl ester carboxylesterase